jgi:hypothetical protein
VPATSAIATQEEPVRRSRRSFRWPKEARELVRNYLAQQRANTATFAGGLSELITRMAEASGNPRDACWRFARQAGVAGKRKYLAWPERAQQRLLDLVAIQPLPEVAIAMHRSVGSIRSMLHRLGASASMGKDWFTKYTLAEALHIRADEVQRWIDRGWLKSRLVQGEKLQRHIIDADDFSAFCKAHSRDVVGRRLNLDRLNFVKDFVFPSSHAEFLPVRASKKERAAYEEQIGRPPESEFDDEIEDEREQEYDDDLTTSA